MFMLKTKKMMRWYIFLTFSLVSLMGCGEKSQALTALPQDAVILAFGDSLTEGVGAKSEDSYPTELARLSGLKVINAGISGETTSEGLQRLEELLIGERPKLMVLLEGGNDILRNQRASRTKENLAQMIEIANQQEVQVVLLGVPSKNLFSGSASFYAELAEEYKLVFDGELIRNLLLSPSYKSDSVHLNASGYAALAERVHSILKDNGAL